MASAHESSIDELAHRSAQLEAEARLLRAEAEKSRAEQELARSISPPLASGRSMWSVIATAIGLTVFLMSIGFAIVAIASTRG